MEEVTYRPSGVVVFGKINDFSKAAVPAAPFFMLIMGLPAAPSFVKLTLLSIATNAVLIIAEEEEEED